MYRKIIGFFLVVFFILTVSVFIHSQDISESDTILINGINIKTYAGEMPARSIDYKDAVKQAYIPGLKLIADEPPFIDNKAFFITQYQTIIPVSGYKKDFLYRLYIDFLRYKEEKVPFNSLLKIFIRDVYGNRRQIGTADLSYMSDKKKYEISIPFDLSYPGKFDIIIQEYSEKPGNWGIWDIIISSKKLNEIDIMSIDLPVEIKEIEAKIFN